MRRLPGFRRVLGVAMDNTVDLPGYKFFRDPRDGSRPAVFVAFADLAGAPGGEVNGVCVPVAAGALGALDARERNYERVDVSDLVPDPPGPGLGLPRLVGRARAARARDGGRTGRGGARATSRACRPASARSGRAEHAAFVASTDFGGLPVVALERVDLP